MKKAIWMAVAVCLATGGLAACGEAPPPADNGPKAPAGISASKARLLLPAVKGNPGAVYFEVSNASEKNMVIRAVSVAGAASAMMHSADMQEEAQVPVGPGQTVKFEPAAQHVMAMDLADTVTPGSTADVTVTFVGGDKISFPADVRAAGDER
jgi:copper(I)-binding protein